MIVQLLLISSTVLITAVWMLQALAAKKLRLVITTPSIVLAALTIISLASARLQSPNPYLATFDRPLTYASLTLMYLSMSSFLHNTQYKIHNTIIIVTIFALTLTTAYSTYRTATTPLLPWSTGLTIATKVLTSSPKTLALGFGPSNFLEAFTKYKPQSFNLTPVWSTHFTQSRNEPLQLATTQGVLGLVGYLTLIICSLKICIDILVKSQRGGQQIGTDRLARQTAWQTHHGTNQIANHTIAGKPISVDRPQLATITVLATILTIALQFLLPTSIPSWWLLVVLLSLLTRLNAPRHPTTLTLSHPLSIWPIAIITLLSITIIPLWWYTSFYAADQVFHQALDAAAHNRGTESYNLHIKAIAKNRYQDSYRASYATTNLALAILYNHKSQLSQADREKVTTLTQQAIREAKIAITLNPQKVTNWETLAAIYTGLIGTTQNAPTWAIDTYQKALATDPNKPTLYLAIGGIYYGQNQYDQALDSFTQAAALKPNWANAYYHLFLAYKAKNELGNARQALDKVLTLLPKSSPDYSKAVEAQTALDHPDQAPAGVLATPSSALSSPNLGQESALQTPSPFPSPNPDRQVNLSKDFSP